MKSTATGILSDEHRVILRVLSCLTAMAERARKGAGLDLGDARDAVYFLREFADLLHHGKEEAELFPALEAAGMPRHGGPVGVMLQEHEQGRGWVREMNAAIAAAESGDVAAARRFADAADNFTALLRDHIEKEDHCLFSMAANMLDGATAERLLAEFRRYDAEEGNRREHERCRAIAERLTARYGVGAADMPGATRSCAGF